MIASAAVNRYADWGYGHIPAVDVYRAGMVGVVRYLSNSPGKNLTPAERDDLLAHGLDILLVWETTTTRSLEGPLAGAADGVLAAQQAQALAYPHGATIFASTDTDTTWDRVAAYHVAFNVAVAHFGYVGDMYAGYAVCRDAHDAGQAPAPWQTAAWSYGQVLPQAWAVQNDFHLPIGGVDCDGSDVQRPANGWRANLPKPSPKPGPKHAPKPKPKPVVVPTPNGVDELSPQDLKDVAALIKKSQDVIILHTREPLLAKIAELEAKIAAKG
jgi:hypothetical protein